MCCLPYAPVVVATTSYLDVEAPTSAATLYTPTNDTSFVIAVAFDIDGGDVSYLNLTWTDSWSNSQSKNIGGYENGDGPWTFAFRAKGGTAISTALTGTNTMNAWVRLEQF